MSKYHGKNGKVCIGAGDGTNEVQTITQSGTAGSFTITYGGATSDPIAFNATQAQIQSYLEGMASIGAGNVLVTGSASNFTITFQNYLGSQEITAVTGTGSSFAVTVTETTKGTAGTANLLAIKSWSADHEVAGDDSTTTEDLGFENTEFGIEKCDWSVEAQWDSSASQDPYATPPNFKPGQTVYLRLQVARSSTAPKFILPCAKVLKASIKSVVDGVVTWAISGKCGGRFTCPT